MSDPKDFPRATKLAAHITRHHRTEWRQFFDDLSGLVCGAGFVLAVQSHALEASACFVAYWVLRWASREGR